MAYKCSGGCGREVPKQGGKCKFCLWEKRSAIIKKKPTEDKPKKVSKSRPPKEKTKKARKRVQKAHEKGRKEKVGIVQLCRRFLKIRPRLKAQIESLEFLSDHTWGQGATEDGQNVSGLKVLRPSPDAQCYPFTYDTRLHFEKPEWTRDPAKSDPISHNRNQNVHVRVTVSFDSKGDYSIQHIKGTPGGKSQQYLQFDAGGFNVKIQKGKSQLQFDLISVGLLPNGVRDLRNISIKWKIEASGHGWKGSLDLGQSGPHRIYVTFGPPLVEQWLQPGWRTWWPEDGLTCARLERAIAMVEPMKTDDTHKIANTIRSWFPDYVFKTYMPAAPYGHSAFMNSQLGGAWCLSDFIAAGGECQAIVRLMRALMNQLGCDGKWAMRVIYASPDQKAGSEAIDGPWPEHKGTSSVVPVQANHKLYGKQFTLMYYVALMDDYQMYSWHEILKDARGNNYEAALRLEYKGKTYYYGGGASRYPTATDVMRDFSALVWTVNYPLQTNDPKLPYQYWSFCAQVIQDYDKSGNKLPGQCFRLAGPQPLLPPHPQQGQWSHVPPNPAPELGALDIDNPPGECGAPSFGASGPPVYRDKLPGLQPP